VHELVGILVFGCVCAAVLVLVMRGSARRVPADSVLTPALRAEGAPNRAPALMPALAPCGGLLSGAGVPRVGHRAVASGAHCICRWAGRAGTGTGATAALLRRHQAGPQSSRVRVHRRRHRAGLHRHFRLVLGGAGWEIRGALVGGYQCVTDGRVVTR
jgi:hypothetical protein